MKKTTLPALLMLVPLVLSCGSTERKPAQEGEGLRVGMIFDVGGRGDKSFNDSAYHGLEMAQEKMGVEFELIEPADAADREAGLRLLAEKDLDLVVAVGFMFTDDINKIAREYAEKRFACVDYTLPPGGEDQVPFNVRALLFREEEGAFLVGALAGYGTRTGRVGFVGGMEIPLIQKFEMAFEAGVQYANPRAEVIAKYAGVTPEAFKDPARGKELALGLYDEGVDIIFQAAGATGLGVFEAARERQKFVIGSDSDQWDEAPGLVLTSMVKHVDRAVFETIRAVAAGAFRGGVTRMGLMTGGIELVFDQRNLAILPPEIRSRMDNIRREIVSKRLEIPTPKSEHHSALRKS